MTETSEFPPMMERFMRAWARRVGEADTYDLGELAAFRKQVDRALAEAIASGRTQLYPWSWTDIGDALGITRQAAQRQWGRAVADVLRRRAQELEAAGG